jgi:hypothetical protein
MEYNIGDMVVRKIADRHYWDMVGVITGKRPITDINPNFYYTIRWFDPKKNIGSDTWQAHEFRLVEDAKKVQKKKLDN